MIEAGKCGPDCPVCAVIWPDEAPAQMVGFSTWVEEPPVILSGWVSVGPIPFTIAELTGLGWFDPEGSV